MGYTTDFEGSWKLNKPLTDAHKAYLNKFSETRRQRRNSNLTARRDDPIRLAVNLPVGEEGCYFVGETGFCGQDHGPDVTDGNSPPSGQPGLWCKWIPTFDGLAIEWSGAEKFYDYVEWIEYLIAHFLKPWGYKLSGTVEWHGEEHSDIGKIVIRNNKVSVKRGRITYR